LILDHYSFDSVEILLAEALICGEVNRLKPILRVAFVARDVNVSPLCVIARVEEESVRAATENRWSHARD
jgi:hypothetical protein